MIIVTSYAVEIKHPGDKFWETVKEYRAAEAFFADVANKEWDKIKDATSHDKLLIVESLTHKTKNRAAVPYDFDISFFNMPSYLRRAAIMDGVGRVSSYRSNLEYWDASSKKGNPPVLSKCADAMPCFYRGNTYNDTEDPTILEVKLYNGKAWDWQKIKVKKTDVQYIKAHCAQKEKSAPTLEYKHGKMFLRFAFTEKIKLYDTPVIEQTVCAVDLGINTGATCSILRADGTILARKFIDFPCDKDYLDKALGRVKRCSRENSSANSSAQWKFAKRINEQMSYKISAAIVDFAVLYSCDAIIFEYLDAKGKKRGRNKEKLAWWRHGAIQRAAEIKAHQNAMHVYHVNAWNTSRLAFDGSGSVIRGKKAGFKANTMCKFQNGKTYNCDLNASYNIGARYFVREILKTLPAKARSQVEAKVPGCGRRTQCVYATLMELHTALLLMDKTKRAAA